jgi:hypothetical protein
MHTACACRKTRTPAQNHPWMLLSQSCVFGFWFVWRKGQRRKISLLVQRKEGLLLPAGSSTPSVIMCSYLAVPVSPLPAAHPFLLRPPSSSVPSLPRSTPPWRAKRRSIAAVSGSFFTADLDPDDYAAEPESDGDSPWEGALVYRRDAAAHHLEYASTLERLGLGDLSSHDSRARAAAMGLGALDLDQPQSQTPVLVSLDVARRRRRLRLDGIVRTVITLGCFRSPFSLINHALLLWSPHHTYDTQQDRQTKIYIIRTAANVSSMCNCCLIASMCAQVCRARPSRYICQFFPVIDRGAGGGTRHS